MGPKIALEYAYGLINLLDKQSLEKAQDSVYRLRELHEKYKGNADRLLPEEGWERGKEARTPAEGNEVVEAGMIQDHAYHGKAAEGIKQQIAAGIVCFTGSVLCFIHNKMIII